MLRLKRSISQSGMIFSEGRRVRGKRATQKDIDASVRERRCHKCRTPSEVSAHLSQRQAQCPSRAEHMTPGTPTKPPGHVTCASYQRCAQVPIGVGETRGEASHEDAKTPKARNDPLRLKVATMPDKTDPSSRSLWHDRCQSAFFLRRCATAESPGPCGRPSLHGSPPAQRRGRNRVVHQATVETDKVVSKMPQRPFVKRAHVTNPLLTILWRLRSSSESGLESV